MKGYLGPSDAPTGAAQCAALNYAGMTGWRLPTIFELDGLFDLSRTPPIDPLFDLPPASAASPYFYSSTTTALVGCGPGQVFNAAAGFSHAVPEGVGACSPMWQYFIRCVHGRAWTPDIPNRFIADVRMGQDVFPDPLTGLEWQGGAGKPVADWAGALSYCEGLVFGGSSDWRLPDFIELLSIDGHSTELGATGGNGMGPLPEYVSASAFNTSRFLGVRSYDGYLYNLGVNDSFVGGPSIVQNPRARCVRLGR